MAASSVPYTILAVAMMMGTLGVGRSVLMIVSGWLAYRAGAAELVTYLPFVGHFVFGLAVLLVAIGLVKRFRHARSLAVVTALVMLAEEAIRSYGTGLPSGMMSVMSLLSIAYMATCLAMVALLTTKMSKDYLQNPSS